MGKIETYDLSDKDIELLLVKQYPTNPCITCGSKGGCCGCQLERDYKYSMKPLHDAGIEEIFFKIKEMKDLENKIYTLQKELNEKIADFNTESDNWKGVEKLHLGLEEWFNWFNRKRDKFNCRQRLEFAHAKSSDDSIDNHYTDHI